MIGDKIGEFMDVDLDWEGIGLGEFLRIRVKLDVGKPLLRGMQVKFSESSYGNVMFQYETCWAMGKRNVRRITMLLNVLGGRKGICMVLG